MNAITRHLRPEDIILDANVSNKHELFELVGRQLEMGHALSPKSVAQALSRREQVGSTGLGLGVAIPHARVTDLERILVAYLRLRSPIPFGAPDGKAVSDILVLLVPKQATEEHLKILADATQMFADRQFRQRLQQGGDRQEVKDLFDAWTEAPSWQHREPYKPSTHERI